WSAEKSWVRPPSCCSRSFPPDRSSAGPRGASQRGGRARRRRACPENTLDRSGNSWDDISKYEIYHRTVRGKEGGKGSPRVLTIQDIGKERINEETSDSGPRAAGPVSAGVRADDGEHRPEGN